MNLFLKSVFPSGILGCIFLLSICPKLIGNSVGSTKNHPDFRPGKDYALLFAVDEYRDKKWQGAKQSLHDAEGIATILKDRYCFLTEVVRNPTRRQISEKLRFYIDRVQCYDAQLFIYFSGVGIEKEGKQFFLPADASASLAEAETFFAYGDLFKQLDSAAASVTVVIDACKGTFQHIENFSEKDLPYYNHRLEDNVNPLVRNMVFTGLSTVALRMYMTYGIPGNRHSSTPFSQKFRDVLVTERSSYGITSLRKISHAMAGEIEPRGEGQFSTDPKSYADFYFVDNIFPPDPKLASKDTDADGVPDRVDFCPFLPGLPAFQGCPDTDRDQIPDILDDTPLGAANAVKQAAPRIAADGFVYVEGGSFEMGDVFGDAWIIVQSGPRKVAVESFYISPVEVKEIEYRQYLTETNSPQLKSYPLTCDNCPIEGPNWYEAIEYCNWRSKKAGFRPVYTINRNQKDPNNLCLEDKMKWTVAADWSANGYRLPTEAEWEYAARERGRLVRYGNGKSSNTGSDINSDQLYYARYVPHKFKRNSMKVASFSPNALGLYDMSGNAKEYCWDYGSYDDRTDQLSGVYGPEKGNGRVIKGGDWWSDNYSLMVATRNECCAYVNLTGCGFRLVRKP